MLVVDDHLLLDLLTEDVRGWLAEAASQAAVYTTASWYCRVANAAEHGSGHGSLSGRIASRPRPSRVDLQLGSLHPSRFPMLAFPAWELTGGGPLSR